MKASFKAVSICSILFVLAGCATTPPTEPKVYINQAAWNKTTKDKVFSACLAALTMERFAVHPMGTKQESGLIVTNPSEFYFKGDDRVKCYYTLQLLVAETQDSNVMISVNAVDTGYKYEDYKPYKPDVKRYMNDRIADDIEKFFAQLDTLLGKAEYYKRDKVLFEDTKK